MKGVRANRAAAFGRGDRHDDRPRRDRDSDDRPPRGRAVRAPLRARDLRRLLLQRSRRVDRGDLRRDVQRQERGAHTARSSRDHREEEGSGVQVAPRRALRRHLPGVEPRRAHGEAVPVDTPEQIARLVLPDTQVVAIDEAQFLDAGVVELVTVARQSRAARDPRRHRHRLSRRAVRPDAAAARGRRSGRQAPRDLRRVRQSRRAATSG